MRLLTQVDRHLLIVSASPAQAKARLRRLANITSSLFGRHTTVSQSDRRLSIQSSFLKRSWEIVLHFVSVGQVTDVYLSPAAE